MPHAATSSPSLKKHNFLPLKDKLELIRKCEAGILHSIIAGQMVVPRSTISTIWKNQDKYRETAASTISTTSLILRGSRDSRLNTMEDMLIRWIEDRTQRKMPISSLVQERALSQWHDLQSTTSTTSRTEDTFTSSRGWFH
ncbi:Tigger transposable element-derived protein 1 [Portunus trituberculatus]|uniref:Tigger transposable element-derived protein 1 n=1 Tax=Portunus trituberculatus TaxID=210409 RepID=A0A5B7HS20_PORTR|nr:Tigger transposable element-derived protein 1 [Portunus trituberculatus]